MGPGRFILERGLTKTGLISNCWSQETKRKLPSEKRSSQTKNLSVETFDSRAESIPEADNLVTLLGDEPFGTQSLRDYRTKLGATRKVPEPRCSILLCSDHYWSVINFLKDCYQQIISLLLSLPHFFLSIPPLFLSHFSLYFSLSPSPWKLLDDSDHYGQLCIHSG